MRDRGRSHRWSGSVSQFGNDDPLAYLGERQSAPMQVGQKVVSMGMPDDPEMAFGAAGSGKRTLFWSAVAVGAGVVILTAVFATSDLFHPAEHDGNGIAVSP